MPISPFSQGTLFSSLTYVPKELQFGTSGRRGDVVDLTHLEIFINVVAELKFLQSLAKNEGGITKGDVFFYAYDLRPSSSHYVAEQGNRGKLVHVVESAIRYMGMVPVNYGQIPTPALTHYAITCGKGSIMVTGSHIPFERNGYKTNTARGELLKQHEKPINEIVEHVRSEFYNHSVQDSLFTIDGFLKNDPEQLSQEQSDAAQAYNQRYVNFFGQHALTGLRVLVYQHSAVGRDFVVDILRNLGAFVVPIGRSDTFVPIDTENVHAAQLATIQILHDAAVQEHGVFDAIVSTDGDSDRPLILGIEAKTATVRFFGGDLAGMITAEFLAPDAIIVPISSNDGIDYGSLKHIVEPKTRIGSPFVIAGMEKALARGKKSVCGWEANGGFLTGSAITRDGKQLSALPTRDAILPILAVLSIAHREKISLISLFARLPERYSCAALLKQFPKSLGLAIVKHFSPTNSAINTVVFYEAHCHFFDETNIELTVSNAEKIALDSIRTTLLNFFTPERGFANIIRINYTDGVRIYFSNQDIAHLRPSGNADELRLYAVANTQQRADIITHLGIQEPNGILRCMEQYVAKHTL